MLKSPLLPDLGDIAAAGLADGSDSQSLDNMLEVLLMGGMDLLQAMRLLMPPAWQSVEASIRTCARSTNTTRCTWSPGMGRPAWCSPTAAMPAARWTATACARRARCITKNRHLTIASEVGRVGLRARGRGAQGPLGPGEMIALDLQTATLLENARHRRAAEDAAIPTRRG